MFGIARGDLAGLEICTQHAFAGASFFNFGDHGCLPGGDFGLECTDEITRRRCKFGHGAHGFERLGLFGGGDFSCFDG